MAVEIGTLAGVGAYLARAKKLESCESEPRSGNKTWTRKATRVRHDLTASIGIEGAESGSE